MTDNLTREQRSLTMSRIKGSNTGPELRLRKALWAAGLRYRLNYKLPGKPDLVVVSARLAVFVDGCFWHGCPEHGVRPSDNSEYWNEKIEGNIRRDEQVNKELRNLGWTVMRFWEHEVHEDLAEVVVQILGKCSSSIYVGRN